MQHDQSIGQNHRSLIVPGLLAGALLVTVALHLPLLNQPFGRDQGIFAYIGDGILHGYIPYRDSWDHKPPGIDFAYAFAFAVFGRHMASVHLLELISILLTAVAVFGFGRRVFGEVIGVGAAFLYGAGTALMFEWWDRGQAEFFMTLPVALSMYCAVRAGILDKRAGPATTTGSSFTLWLGLAGFFAGLAIYFKPTAGVMLALLALMVLLAAITPTRYLLRGIVGLFALSIGSIVSMIPLIAYFGFNGALNDLYEATIVFNTYHIQTGANLTLDQMIAATFDYGARMGFLAPLAALGAIVAIGRRHWGGIVTASWFIFLGIGVWTQGKFFSYHWSTLLAPLSLMAALGLIAVWDSFSPQLRQLPSSLMPAKTGASSGLAIVVLPLMVFVYAVVLYEDQVPKLGRDLSYSLGLVTEQSYLANFGHNLRGVDVYSFSAAQETAKYVAERTNSQDTVFVWGFQALVNYLANRRSPTRYVFNYPLTIDQPDSDLRAKARKTFLDDITRNKPKYVILVTNDVNPLQAVDSFTLLKGFPEFKNLVDTDYTLEKDIADFHIYRRKGSQ